MKRDSPSKINVSCPGVHCIVELFSSSSLQQLPEFRAAKSLLEPEYNCIQCCGHKRVSFFSFWRIPPLCKVPHHSTEVKLKQTRRFERKLGAHKRRRLGYVIYVLQARAFKCYAPVLPSHNSWITHGNGYIVCPIMYSMDFKRCEYVNQNLSTCKTFDSDKAPTLAKVTVNKTLCQSALWATL